MKTIQNLWKDIWQLINEITDSFWIEHSQSQEKNTNSLRRRRRSLLAVYEENYLRPFTKNSEFLKRVGSFF